jgi:hypothetical protein
VYVQFGSILDRAAGSISVPVFYSSAFPFHPNSFSPVSIILHASSIHPTLSHFPPFRHYSQYNRLQYMHTPASVRAMLNAVSSWPWSAFRTPRGSSDYAPSQVRACLRAQKRAYMLICASSCWLLGDHNRNDNN